MERKGNGIRYFFCIEGKADNFCSFIKSSTSKFYSSQVISGESGDALWVQSLDTNVWEISYDKYQEFCAEMLPSVLTSKENVLGKKQKTVLRRQEYN